MSQKRGSRFLGGCTSQPSSEDQIAKERDLFADHPFAGRVKGDFSALAERRREEFHQPGFVHSRREAQDDIEFAVAVLDFVNLRGHEQPAVPYGAVAGEFATPPVYQITTQRAFVPPQCQLINKRRQDAVTNRLLTGAALVDGEPLMLCHM